MLATGFTLYRSQLHALPATSSGSGSVSVCPVGIDNLNQATTAFTKSPITCGGDVCTLDPAPRDVPPAIKDGQAAAVATSPELDAQVAALKAQIDDLIKNHQYEIEVALKQYYDKTFNTSVDAEQALSSTLAIAQDLYALLKKNSNVLTQLVNSDVGKAAQKAYFNRIFAKEEKYFGDIWSGSLSHTKDTNLSYDTSWNIFGSGGITPTLSVNGLYKINTSKIAVSASYACKPNIGKAKDNILSDGNWQANIKFTAPTHILGHGVQNIGLGLSASNQKPITFKATLEYRF
jgi:hypothetical protein